MPRFISNSPAPRPGRGGRPTDETGSSSKSSRYSGRYERQSAGRRRAHVGGDAQALVDRREEERLHLVDELFVVGRSHVGVECLLVLPDLERRELARRGGALENLETHDPRLLAALLRQLL